jgi:DNA-binding LacI/PurR family transcriptional regulator
MNRTRFDPELPRKLLAQFLAEPRQPGDRFWTTREIMQRFSVTLYAANAAVRELVQQRVLERKHRVGTFVAAAGQSALKTGPVSTRANVGVVWPGWAAESERNPWATNLRAALVEECHRRGWRFSLFQEPGQFADALFPTRFSVAGCNRLLMMSAVEEGIVPLTKLREAGVPLASIGHLSPAFESLRISVIEGDDEEAIRRLVFQLRREGCRRLLVLGFHNPRLGTDRVRGCVNAFEQFAHEYPADTFVESHDPDYLAATVAKRLSGRFPVEAMIFENHYAFLAVWERTPLLREKLPASPVLAVFDEYHLRQRFPDLPLIEVMLNPRVLARTSLDILDAQARGERVRNLTLLAYEILWPNRARATAK